MGKFTEDCIVGDTVKGLGEVQCIYNDVWIGLQMICYGLDEMYDCCYCGSTGPERKLVGEN